MATYLSVGHRKAEIRKLLDGGPHNMTEIVEHLGEPRSTVAATIDRMGDVEKVTGKGHPQYQLKAR